MGDTVRVRLKKGKEELTFYGITQVDAPVNQWGRLRLFQDGPQMIAEFDKQDISSWYVVPPPSPKD